MKDTINRITSRIITDYTFMGVQVRLALDNDNVVWDRRKANDKFREPSVAGFVFRRMSETFLSPWSSSLLFFKLYHAVKRITLKVIANKVFCKPLVRHEKPPTQDR